MIESQVTGRDSRLWVELGLMTYSCNPLESFVTLLNIIVERIVALSPILGQYWTELGKQIYVCSLSISPLLFYLLLVFIIVTHVFLMLD